MSGGKTLPSFRFSEWRQVGGLWSLVNLSTALLQYIVCAGNKTTPSGPYTHTWTCILHSVVVLIVIIVPIVFFVFPPPANSSCSFHSDSNRTLCVRQHFFLTPLYYTEHIIRQAGVPLYNMQQKRTVFLQHSALCDRLKNILFRRAHAQNLFFMD